MISNTSTLSNIIFVFRNENIPPITSFRNMFRVSVYILFFLLIEVSKLFVSYTKRQSGVMTGVFIDLLIGN